ncbi:MBL fold metallo-hydrolase [Streptomyces sp. NPDC005811]|uniref:MBL fold metallo-hydrolase n=1 Tax=Streptomyces sp. NPDC005811 TaxID=3154565 RepID=UPI0033CB74DE
MHPIPGKFTSLNSEELMMDRRDVIRRGGVAAGIAALSATGLGSPAAAATGQGQVPEFLPLPEHAKPFPIPAEGYRLEPVGKNGYVVSAGVAQGYFFVTQAGVVMLDAPVAVAEFLPLAVKRVTKKPVTHLILTHDHDDHIGGAIKFPKATVVSHELTAQLLRVYTDPDRPVPDVTFSGKRHTLRVGGEHFELIYPGPNHENGNIIVHLPKQKIAMMSDVVAPGWAPYLHYGNADHIPGILRAMDAVLELDFDVFLGGHTYRTGNRHDVEVCRAFFIDQWNWTVQAMKDIPMDVSIVEAGNLWAAQAVWFNRIADNVTPRLVKKYGKELAAVDAFTHDNIKAIIVSSFTDDPHFPADALK